MTVRNLYKVILDDGAVVIEDTKCDVSYNAYTLEDVEPEDRRKQVLGLRAGKYGLTILV